MLTVLQGVKSQYSSEVTALQQKLEVSLSKEVEAQEMVKTLREIVQKDVARLRTELSQVRGRGRGGSALGEMTRERTVGLRGGAAHPTPAAVGPWGRGHGAKA